VPAGHHPVRIHIEIDVLVWPDQHDKPLGELVTDFKDFAVDGLVGQYPGHTVKTSATAFRYDQEIPVATSD
jgi:hypothetical protein